MSELQRVKQALAEAQQQLQTWERQGQIEAALERVRTRTMAMHRSEELADVVGTVYRELQHLGFDPQHCEINIYRSTSTARKPLSTLIDASNEKVEVWLSTGEEGYPDSFTLSTAGYPLWQEVIEAWQRGDSFVTYELYGQAYHDHLKYIFSQTEYRRISPEDQQAFFELDGMVMFAAYHRYGAIGMGGPEPPGEEQQRILIRFAHVFEQTYTRFLDLQQAEERAREAVRQASVDRVRAEIASMRTAGDLEHITPLVWRELTTLGVPFFRCGVFIIDETTEHVDLFLSTPHGEHLASLHLPFDCAPIVREAVVSWEAQQIHAEIWDQQQFVAWTQSLMELGQIETLERYRGGDVPPDSLALQFVPFAQGMLYIGSSAPLSDDDIDLVQALADAFVIAYARYEDFRRLEVKNQEVERALAHLRRTQAQLVQAEKMASLGQLTSGIAHELKNPLNFVNNFAEVNEELARDLLSVLVHDGDRETLEDLAHSLKTNAVQIAKHGKRADAIVKSMMEHASSGASERYRVEVNGLVDEYVTLAYHGKQAQVPGMEVAIERRFGTQAGTVEMAPRDIGRVLLNLLGNAFDAVQEHTAGVNSAYEPTVTVSTQRVGDQVEIRVSDNGPGIPQEIRERIFEPFFTTKPTGSGTGLGLSLAYDIVTQGHGGTLTVESSEGEGATFVVTLPAG